MRLREEFAKFPLKLVVNQTRSAEEEKLGEAISGACQRYFGISMDFLGSVPFDDAVWQSIRKRRPVLIDKPDAAASRGIIQIARSLGFGSA